MIRPHAIMLTPNNMAEIISWTNASWENMKELYIDSVEEKTPYYIVFFRNEDGTPNWYSYTEEEYEKSWRAAHARDHFMLVEPKN